MEAERESQTKPAGQRHNNRGKNYPLKHRTGTPQAEAVQVTTSISVPAIDDLAEFPALGKRAKVMERVSTIVEASPETVSVSKLEDITVSAATRNHHVSTL